MGYELLARTISRAKAERLQGSPLVIVETRINAKPPLGDKIVGVGEVR